MRPVPEIQQDLDDALEDYRAVAATATPAVLHEKSRRVRALQAELAAALSDGADPCPTCQVPPHGMLRTPPAGRAPAIYEVGCTRCGRAAQGLTSAGATAAWNALPAE